MPTFKLTVIYETSIADLVGGTIDLSGCGTPGEIRFIDCVQMHDHDTLRIYETNTLFPPKDRPYAVVSYVWRGYKKAHSPSSSHPAFHAKGAEDGEPISTRVLAHACAAALHEGARLLWLDRLCIMQTNDEDKAWQIQQMHAVYARAAVCFVLPGGVNRLVGLGEDTPWIHRAWTLQELLAPARSLVLFAWKHGAGTYSGATSGRVVEVVSGRTAMADATDILQFCEAGNLTFAPRDGRAAERQSVSVRIFGKARSPQLWATMGALRLRDSESGESAVWRSALMRTSSRPVDMIFSIMGLFGVSLKPKDFDKNDRIAATLALAKSILETGRSASWIGASFHLPASTFLSSFPTFPKSSVSGQATVTLNGEEKAVSEVVDGDYMSQWWLRSAPRGRIDQQGYLVIEAQAAAISLSEKRGDATPGVANRSVDLRKDGKTYYIKDLQGNKWLVDKHKPLSSTTKSMVVFVGIEGRISSLTTYKFSEDTPVRAIAVKRHAEGKWHRVGSFFLGQAFKNEVKTWETFPMAIGGPKSLSERQLEIVRRKEHKVRRKPIESS